MIHSSLRFLWQRPAACWTLLALVVAVFAWRHAGRSWDDGVEAEYGRAVWDYFASGGDTWRPPEVDGGVVRYYGTLCGLADSAWHALLGLPHHSQRPWVISWFWIGCFAPVVAVAARIAGGPAGGWLAGLALCLMPRMFGEAFVNPKDLPLACGFAWCVWSACRLVVPGRAGWLTYALAGGMAGLALAARPAAVFALGPLFLVTTWRLARAFGSEGGKAAMARDAAGLALAVIVAFGVTSLMWPTVWREGAGAWLEALRLAKSFSVAYPVLYLGVTEKSDALPWHYPFVYLAITLPLPLLALFAAGKARLAGLCVGLVREWRGGRGIEALTVLLFLAFPFVVFLVARPNIYDGIRHFLFVIPLVAVAAGVGGAWVIKRMAAKGGVARKAAAFVVVAALGYGVLPIARMYPFSLAYFNPLAGPARTVHTRFETDYWVLSYREAAEWVNARQQKSGRPLRVIVAANGLSLPAFTTFLDPHVEVAAGDAITTDAALPEGVDYYVGMVRYGLAQRFPASPVVKRLERGGMLFGVVRGGANVELRDETGVRESGEIEGSGKARAEAFEALRAGNVSAAVLGLDAHLLAFPEDRLARVLLAEILKSVGVEAAARQQARLASAGFAAEDPVAQRAAAVMGGLN